MGENTHTPPELIRNLVLLSDRTSSPRSTPGGSHRPYDPASIQPSSIDVRPDRYFRVRQPQVPHIDPAVEQPDLTRLVEVDPDEAFILHPGEFVLASTLEAITLPTDLASRLRARVPGPVGAPHPLHGRVHRPRLLRT